MLPLRCVSALVAMLVLMSCRAGVRDAVEPPAVTESGPAASSAPGTEPPRALLPTMPDLHPSVDDWEQRDVVLRAGPDDPGVVVRTRVASSADQRAHGLMEVPHLPDGAGMLFSYVEDRTGAFWMKGTLIALDIAWIDADGFIVAVATMTPCDEDPCPTWAPGTAYRQALEVPAGFLDRQGFGVGATVTGV